MKIKHVFYFAIVLCVLYLMTGDCKKVSAASLNMEQTKEAGYELQGEDTIIIDAGKFRTANEDMLPVYKKIKHIIIKQGSTNVYNGRFKYFENAVDFTIPSSVTYIAREITSELPSLEQFIVDDNNTKYASVDGILYDKAKEKLIVYPRGSRLDVVIPKGTKIIGENAFAGMPITTVVLPDGMIAIQKRAFMNTKLTTLSLPASFRILEKECFMESPVESVSVAQDNKSLCSVDGIIYDKGKTLLYYWPEVKTVSKLELPKTLTYLDCKCIPTFSEVRSIVIPDTLTAIINTEANQIESVVMDNSQPYFKLQDGVLYSADFKRIRLYPNQNKNTTITIHKNLTEFPIELFATENTTKVLVLPENLKQLKGKRKIGSMLLSGFCHLKEIQLSEKNPSFQVVDGVLYNSDMTKLLWYPSDLPQASFQIPDSVKLVDNDQFVVQNNLEKLSIPKDCKIYDLDELNDNDWHWTHTVPVGKECPKLKEFVVKKGNPYYTSVDGVLFSKDMATLYMYPSAKTDKAYSIPKEVRRANFLNANAYLEKLTISKDLSSFNVIEQYESEGNIYGDSLMRYPALEEILVDSENKSFKSMDGVLVSNSGSRLVAYPMAKKSSEFELPAKMYIIDNPSYLTKQPYLKTIYVDRNSEEWYIEDGKLKYYYDYDDVEFGEKELKYK